MRFELRPLPQESANRLELHFSLPLTKASIGQFPRIVHLIKNQLPLVYLTCRRFPIVRGDSTLSFAPSRPSTIRPAIHVQYQRAVHQQLGACRRTIHPHPLPRPANACHSNPQRHPPLRLSHCPLYRHQTWQYLVIQIHKCSFTLHALW